MSNRESTEYRAFRKCFSLLADGITDPGRLAIQLYSKELIKPELRTEAQNPAIAERVKIEKLLSAVENQIVVSPVTKFWEFLDVLQKEPSLQYLTEKLESTYRELCTPSALPTTATLTPSPLTVCTQPTTPIPIPSRRPLQNSYQPLPLTETPSTPPSQHFTPSSPPINTSKIRPQKWNGLKSTIQNLAHMTCLCLI